MFDVFLALRSKRYQFPTIAFGITKSAPADVKDLVVKDLAVKDLDVEDFNTGENFFKASAEKPGGGWL